MALRGLTVGATLTLIDSERMVAYPLNDDNQRSFVDVSAIPVDAIDTVEVLKDNASAIYGSDAIAGVVNIKLKQSYVGSEVTAEYGASQHWDGNTIHAAAIIGWGDLANDGYNIYAALDWHKQDLILGSSRSGPWTNLNWSGLPGGLNEKAGLALAEPVRLSGYHPGLCGQSHDGSALDLTPGPQPQCNSTAAQNAGNCEFSFPGQIQPPTEQTNFLTKITKALAGDWTMTWTGSVFDSVSQQVAPQSPPFGHALNQTGINSSGNTIFQFGPGITPRAIPYPVYTLPADSPQNPFGVPAQLAYSFPDIGPNVIDSETTTYRLFADVRGTAGGWDLDGQVGLMYARTNLDIYGYVEPGALQSALNGLAYVPGSTTNGARLRQPRSPSPSSTLDVIDLHGTHDLFQMPGGPLTSPPGCSTSTRRGMTSLRPRSRRGSSQPREARPSTRWTMRNRTSATFLEARWQASQTVSRSVPPYAAAAGHFLPGRASNGRV